MRDLDLILVRMQAAEDETSTLIGKGWNSMGLRANSEHAADKSALIYAQSKASLNLFGGCVHELPTWNVVSPTPSM